ncbi:MAG: hypothetical protein EOL89_09380 [Actinobacteria bacterium]|nr:hypothetical protein [Actinomycetota bacterium]
MNTLEELDLHSSGYRPSLRTGVTLALVLLATSALIALGHSQGTLDTADTLGWVTFGGGVMLPIVGVERSS